MILSLLLGKIKIEYKTKGDLQIDVTDICYDSRKAGKGIFFFCLCGASSDGHDYARKAYDSGCRVFALERDIDLPDDATCVYFENTREALAYVSAAFFDFPAKQMRLVGITGTKGKTTSANMIAKCLCNAGIPCGYIGTSGIDYAELHFDTKNTTPESYELHKTFRAMLDSGVKCAVLEVSSQALFNFRVAGIEFLCGVYTNLSPDHIGPTEHPNFEHYKSCKKRLFSMCEKGVFNADDDYFADMTQDAKCSISSYGIKNEADYCAKALLPFNDGGRLGVSCTVTARGKQTSLKLSMPGEYSVLNALAVITVCDIFGVSPESSAKALENVFVPGRFEIVPMFGDRIFIIDYAHNEVSLKTLLETVRSYNPKRIVCLFGSVGERTKNRRRGLGSVASELADLSIITSDNPGNEKPMDIACEIASYFKSSDKYIKIPDRAEAIRYAVQNSRPGDIVLLCGKGHENYQLIGSERVPFCERELLLDEYKKISK